MAGGDMALRKNDGKAQLSYLLEFPHAAKGLASIFEYGAEKYARRNWKLGRPVLETVDSLLRHLMSFVNGEDYDDESQLLHVDHVLVNAIFLAEWYRTHPEMDDRGKDNEHT